MSPLFDIAHHVAATTFMPMESTGFLDLLSTKNTAVQVLLRAFSVTLGIIFVIIQGVISRGALPRIIVAGIAAALFVWIVWNVTALQNRVDNEVNAGGPPAAVAVQDHRDLTRPI